MIESRVTPDAQTRERHERGSQKFCDRLSFLQQNFKFCMSLREGRLDWNASLNAIARVQKRRVNRQPFRARVHPEIELIINHWARECATRRGAKEFERRDVEEAAARALRELRQRRGRPANDLLEYHVHALMALWRQTFGEDIKVSASLNSNTEPRILAPADRLLPAMFRTVDRAATTGAIVRIIRLADRSGVVKGKRFENFFPLYGSAYDAETGAPTGGPEYLVERFERSEPIYVS